MSGRRSKASPTPVSQAYTRKIARCYDSRLICINCQQKFMRSIRSTGYPRRVSQSAPQQPELLAPWPAGEPLRVGYRFGRCKFVENA
jgi:hypothetical protein